jgi:hypothetical protein
MAERDMMKKEKIVKEIPSRIARHGKFFVIAEQSPFSKDYLVRVTEDNPKFKIPFKIYPAVNFGIYGKRKDAIKRMENVAKGIRKMKNYHDMLKIL